jgi:branched-chain amino acid transport system permease protein
MWVIAGSMLAALIVVCIAPGLLDTYTTNILVRAFFVATAAVTVDLLWGFTGTLTFGQSAYFGIGAYVLAIVFTQFGFNATTALLGFGGAILLGAIVAAGVGWLSFYPGSTPLYASVISLVLPIVLVQLLYSGGTFTGSSSGLVGFESFDLDLATWFRLAGSGMIVVTAILTIVVRSDAGKLLMALKDNDNRCAYLGINTAHLRIIVLIAAAVIASIAGFGYAGFSAVAAPENASFGFGTDLVVMVALGGRGTLVGAVIGALVIETASAYLSGSLPFVWGLIVGIAFVFVIVVLPSGLLGGLRSLATKVFRLGGRDPSGVSVRLVATPTRTAGPEGHAAETVITIEGVAKRFGSLSVLSDVTFQARRGELVSLVGPNGAGKTTLIRCMADGRERSSGRVTINGISIDRSPPDRIVHLGLGRKFQAASVFETLSVIDCLRIARTRHETPSFIRSSPVLALPAAALAIIEASGLAERLNVEARLLSHGLKQALELAMVLSLEPDVVLLDEPTAGLTRVERQQFANILTELVSSAGICVLTIEHDLDFVREISSRIIVLHQGRLALDGTVAEVVSSELVAEIYTGHASKPSQEAE